MFEETPRRDLTESILKWDVVFCRNIPKPSSSSMEAHSRAGLNIDTEMCHLPFAILYQHTIVKYQW